MHGRFCEFIILNCVIFGLQSHDIAVYCYLCTRDKFDEKGLSSPESLSNLKQPLNDKYDEIEMFW